MKKTFTSRHIPLSSVAGHEKVTGDINVFNCIKRTSIGLKEPPRDEDDKPLGDSVHIQLKNMFNVNDYFVNSAHQQALQALKSSSELLEYHTDTWEDRISEMQSQLTKKQKYLSELTEIKNVLIVRSKERKTCGIPKTPLKFRGNYFHLLGNGSITAGSGRHMKVYDNEYLFEVRYVTPQMSRLKSNIAQITNRIEHTKAQIRNHHPKVCFGTKKLYKLQDSVFASDHETWKHKWEKIRSSWMLISGRHDLSQGNPVFKYNTVTHMLSYTSMDGTVIQMKADFPYGQDDIDRAVSAGTKERRSVAWGIKRTGGSFLISCTVDIPEDLHKNFDLSTGVVSMDMNVDNISLSDVDRCGNLLEHKVIRFDIVGKTSEQVKHILSDAVDKAMDFCMAKRKPFAMEDISRIKKMMLYKDSSVNRMLSSFAYSLIGQFVFSKAEKRSIGVYKTDPSYTSQIGKMKYMRRYGLSVHEAASFVIGRRILGLKERIPKELAGFVSPKARKCPPKYQWGSVYKKVKSLPWRNGYFVRRGPYETVTELKAAYNVT